MWPTEFTWIDIQCSNNPSKSSDFLRSTSLHVANAAPRDRQRGAGPSAHHTKASVRISTRTRSGPQSAHAERSTLGRSERADRPWLKRGHQYDQLCEQHDLLLHEN